MQNEVPRLLKPVAGTTVQLADRQKEIIEVLEERIKDLQEGRMKADNMVLVLWDGSDIDTFWFDFDVVGRYSGNIGVLETVKYKMHQTMLEDGD
jgi:hypothetical protein